MFDRAMAMVEEGVRTGIFPSAAFSVGVGEKVLVAGAWGKTCIEDPAAPADTSTLYDIASMSKVVSTTMLAFKMMEEGKLCLRDPVSSFFPVPDDKRSINIRHLMTHTSGFPDHFYLYDHTKDPAEAAYVILNCPLAYEVGTETIYSCMGYILLGKILEKIGGAPLDVLAEKYVFVPMGMKQTTYRPTGNVACTELDSITGKYWHATVHDENARFLNGISGNAGVFSSLNDMTRFASMLANGGRIDGKAFLSEPMLKAATRNYTQGLRQNRGLGFKLHGEEAEFMGDLFSPCSFGHTGFTGTSLAVNPENGLFVVLLTNRVHPTRKNDRNIRFRNLLHNCVAAEYAQH